MGEGVRKQPLEELRSGLDRLVDDPLVGRVAARTPEPPPVAPATGDHGYLRVASRLSLGSDVTTVDDPADAQFVVVTADTSADGVDRSRASDLPVIAVVQTGSDLARLRDLAPTLTVSENPGLAGAVDLILPATVDTGTFNPMGWRRAPPHRAFAIVQRPPRAGVARALASADVRILLLGDLGRAELPDDLRTRADKRIRSPRDLATTLQKAAALVVHDELFATALDRERMVLRALAVGTPVIDVGSDGGDELPVQSLSVDDLSPALDLLEGDEDLRERRSIHGRRHVLRRRSRSQAVSSVLEHLGEHTPPMPRVSVILSTNRSGFLAHALRSVAAQDYPELELVLVLHDIDRSELPEAGLSGLRHRIVDAPSTWTLGDCLNRGLDVATGRLVAKMDDDDYYGEPHIWDLVLAHGYSGADVVGKWIEYVYLAARDQTVSRGRTNPERDRDHVGGPSMLLSRSLARDVRFLRLPRRVDTTLYERVRARGGRVYGTHSRDVILQRHGGHHAWDVDSGDFLQDARQVWEGVAREQAFTTTG